VTFSLPQVLHSLSPARLGLVVGAMAFLMVALCVGLFYSMAVEQQERILGERVKDLALLAASTIPAEKHALIRSPDQIGGELHRKVLEPLVEFHRRIPEIHYLYTMIYDGDREFFVLDTAQDPSIGERPDTVPSAIMEEFVDDHPEDAAARIAVENGKPFLFARPYKDSFGRFISAMAPILGPDGRFEGYVGVDYRISEYDRSLAQMAWMAAIALLVGLVGSLILGLLSMSLRDYSLRQVNERSNAEEAMREAKEKAEMALQAKRELLSIAAHDLKNPLAAIVGVSDMTAHYLKDIPNRYLPEGTRNLFFKIPRYADNMLSIIEEVLKAETIDRIGMQVADTPFNVSEVAAEVVEFNRFAAKKKKTVIHYVCDRAFFMTGDRDRVMEALDNLISNAVKYSPPGSRVDVALGCDLAQTQLRFSVTDEGPGLSIEDQKKLFQKFQKLSAKPTGGETSSGLGLSIAKHIIEAHQGRVTCESEEGFGATFIIELPIVEVRSLYEDAAPVPGLKGPNRKSRSSPAPSSVTSNRSD